MNPVCFAMALGCPLSPSGNEAPCWGPSLKDRQGKSFLSFNVDTLRFLLVCLFYCKPMFSF